MIICGPGSCLKPRIWLSTRDYYGRVGGNVSWGTEHEPRWVEYLTAWPVLRLRLVKERRQTQLQVAIQIRKSSWHAHLPRGRLGIPAKFRIDAAASQSCLRYESDSYIFDFTGMSPAPVVDHLERRAVVLLEDIENFRRHHPEVLERLGIEVAVKLRDQSE